ncbi:uncharacterized protein LOC9636725 isoform X2 [Selaginella moellendorffii]|uniref:uncharacterized protein LOC9636725 isoform X2 n=1 Tax=Selaginella moellendorffii TaxID=88036 RepID=UPI000D1C2FEE|nr:uncharacterized protein LOC9636725 isoform X2 [Selaginella moellendorffii]|eukprot:XP_024535303.1 uncharacterized protein LOC9636725 isoform X2 [Selaginella moellendorffii]
MEKDVVESRDKNGDSIQQLSSDLRTTISDLQLKLDDWKLDRVSNKQPETSQERVQSLEAALQIKEKEFRQQEKCCRGLKASLLKKDQLLRLAETTLRSIFSRQEASFELFEYLKGKMEQDKSFVRKTLADLNDEIVDSKFDICVQPRGSSKSPEKSRSRKSFSRKPQENLYRVDDILSRITKGRKHCQGDSESISDDDSSRDESPYFWLRARRPQEDLSPLINEIGRLEENWRRTEARMRAEISRRVLSPIGIPNPDGQQQQQQH